MKVLKLSKYLLLAGLLMVVGYFIGQRPPPDLSNYTPDEKEVVQTALESYDVFATEFFGPANLLIFGRQVGDVKMIPGVCIERFGKDYKKDELFDYVIPVHTNTFFRFPVITLYFPCGGLMFSTVPFD